MRPLTRYKFGEFKRDWAFYRPSHSIDANGDAAESIPDVPCAVVHTMWHPEEDQSVAAGYGRDLDSVKYAIIYDEPDIRHGDIVYMRGKIWDVVGIQEFNTHWQVSVALRKGQEDG